MKSHPSCKHVFQIVTVLQNVLSSILEVPGEISFILKALIKSQLNDTEPTTQGYYVPWWDDMMKLPDHRTVEEY